MRGRSFRMVGRARLKSDTLLALPQKTRAQNTVRAELVEASAVHLKHFDRLSANGRGAVVQMFMPHAR